MIGILVQLLVSWLVIWLYERNDLRVVGLRPTGRRLGYFFLFMVVTAVCCASGFLIQIGTGAREWMVNPQLNTMLVAVGLWWNVKSVLFEELIFRGVLFYILIRRLGMMKAILISSAAFGMYHWFSQGSLGNPVAMVVTFFVTGTAGLIYAFGYARSMSLYVPIAIHLAGTLRSSLCSRRGQRVMAYLCRCRKDHSGQILM